ncbi:hypothetical protein DWV92_05000 [Bifidobacterium pseudolongum]|uniref:Uncharacterized protein n=1 Tax=Bifidobacterium pseudolongum TaxID=1694 RepID=A0A395XHQ2_9BIFI|nr:hypothetical protein DWV92_05000 [Bifidobacterium pseudolongum]
MPSSSFREFNIVSVDGKPFYHELIDNEQGINIYDEAIDRLWQMVQLLEITIRASHDAVSIDRERIAIMFGNNTARPVPPLCLDRIPALQDSLRGFQDALYRSKPFELLLFESPIFTVNDEWFAIMRKGADALHTAYRAAMTALISQ